MNDSPELVQVGWYCWRCEGLVEQPCRSDNVPVSVPAEWAGDMEAEIRRHGEEPDDADSEASDWRPEDHEGHGSPCEYRSDGSCAQPARIAPEEPADAGTELARHITDQPVSVIQRAFRELGWGLTFEIKEQP